MLSTFLTSVFAIFTLKTGQPLPKTSPTLTENTLSSREFSLADRYQVPSVNEVFKKNILLNLAYLDKSVSDKKDINWDKVEKSVHYSFTLQPGQSFAFHDDVSPEYTHKISLTTNAHFDSDEGFVSDGYLVGDGVCHFASLINWAAEDAHLDVLVTKNHDFAVIPEVPKTYGVSIYDNAAVKGSGQNNNLYITNNKDHEVTFHFDYENDELKVSVTELHLLAAK